MTTHRIEVPASAEVLAAWQTHIAESKPSDDDGITAREYAAIAGCCVQQANRVLSAGVKNGTYTCGTARRVSASGVMTPRPVYKLVEKTKPKRK